MKLCCCWPLENSPWQAVHCTALVKALYRDWGIFKVALARGPCLQHLKPYSAKLQTRGSTPSAYPGCFLQAIAPLPCRMKRIVCTAGTQHRSICSSSVRDYSVDNYHKVCLMHKKRHVLHKGQQISKTHACGWRKKLCHTGFKHRTGGRRFELHV